jgi:hypothetical protein
VNGEEIIAKTITDNKVAISFFLVLVLLVLSIDTLVFIFELAVDIIYIYIENNISVLNNLNIYIYIMKYLFIDIRKSDEVYAKHFDQSQEYSFYNIPMNMIRFNSQYIIKHLEEYDEIYIVCLSSSRSQFIKNKYFKNYEKIKVSKNLQFVNLKHGSNNVLLNENNIKINIVGSNSFNFYNVMRIIQTIMGVVMLSIGTFLYIQLRKDGLLKNTYIIPLVILMLFGSMALYNGLTSTCSISILLEDYLN